MDFKKLPFQFDVVQLQNCLKQLSSDDWIAHFVKQNYQGSWDVIALRGPKGETHPIRQAYSDPSQSEFEDTPILAKLNYLENVLGSFKCPKKSVRLMKLKSGSKIHEHTDLDLSLNDGTVRIHIPIVTHPDVKFYLASSLVKMAAGECWYLNFTLPHSVCNDSQVDRVHLVLDMDVNQWLLDILN